MSVRIEFADEPVSIFLGEFSELSNERFNEVAAGFFKSLCAAEIGGVRFYEVGIEIVLADQEAELVAQSRPGIARAVPTLMTIVTRPGRDRHLRSGERPELFDTTESDSVGFSESAVDGSRLGDSHLGAADQGRRVKGTGVSVTDEAFGVRSMINRRFEDPVISERVGRILLKSRVYTCATLATSQS
jgi:hypothetical protein